MNWLSHLYLSEPNPAFRIGNLLPDLAPMSALSGLPTEFLRGIAQHRRIDAFTDSHAIFRRSISRVGPEFRRYGGILVDIFYDHFLTQEWPVLCAVPLEQFTDEVYASFERHRHEIPTEAYGHLERMKSANWLCAYGDLGGVALTLRRISERLRKPVPLANAVPIFESDYAGFRDDFAAFFPELTAHVRVGSC
jgi:acyl carrier protein phosphodiesterase